MRTPRTRRKVDSVKQASLTTDPFAKHPHGTPNGKGDAMIEMSGIVKTFKNAAGEFTALKGIDLNIKRGEFVSIVGKSGSGKSTLLNMITGIDHPTSGKVVIGGTDIYTGVTESQRSRWRGRNLGIVFSWSVWRSSRINCLYWFRRDNSNSRQSRVPWPANRLYS
jgi:ABC-type glutathione transport system ATPase component